MNNRVFRVLGICLFIAFLCLSYKAAQAEGGPIYWTQEADVIFVGRLANISSLTPTQFSLTGIDSMLHSTKVYQPTLAAFQVSKVYKSDRQDIAQCGLVVFPFLPAQVRLKGSTFSLSTPLFSQFKENSDYLIFAHRAPGSAYYELLSDNSTMPSAIELGGGKMTDQSWKFGTDLNLDFLSQLTYWAEGSDVSLIKTSLDILTVFGVFEMQGDFLPLYAANLDGMPDLTTLREFIKSDAIPVVRRLYRDTDEGVRQKALFAGASLQDTSVISILSSINASNASSVGHDLSQFHSKAALSALRPFLTDQNDDIRVGATQAVSVVSSIEVIPWLLDSLDDPNEKVRFFALVGLAIDASDARLLRFDEPIPTGSEADTIAFWKSWEVRNQTLISKIEQGQVPESESRAQ